MQLKKAGNAKVERLKAERAYLENSKKELTKELVENAEFLIDQKNINNRLEELIVLNQFRNFRFFQFRNFLIFLFQLVRIIS
jgi:hypothetical protein